MARCGVSGAAPDPPDRIEWQIKNTADAIPSSLIRTGDALALVEVARAARELLESRLWESGDGSQSWQKANALAAALARLDGN